MNSLFTQSVALGASFFACPGGLGAHLEAEAEGGYFGFQTLKPMRDVFGVLREELSAFSPQFTGPFDVLNAVLDNGEIAQLKMAHGALLRIAAGMRELSREDHTQMALNARSIMIQKMTSQNEFFQAVRGKFVERMTALASMGGPFARHRLVVLLSGFFHLPEIRKALLPEEIEADSDLRWALGVFET